MTDPLASPLPVGGAEHEIWRYLLQVVAIGEHKGAWDAKDVVRVATLHLSHDNALRREWMRERARADLAEAENRRLRARIVSETPPGQRVVELTPRLHRVCELIVAGLSNDVIGERLGLTLGTVSNAVGMVMRELEVASRAEVIVAVWSREVALRVKASHRAAA